jgi:hypothetical protein
VKPFARYTLARLGLLVAVGALGYLAGLRGLLLVAGAFVVSGVLSYLVLARQRTALSAVVERSVTRSRSRLAQRTAREDRAAEVLTGSPSGRDLVEPPVDVQS